MEGGRGGIRAASGNVLRHCDNGTRGSGRGRRLNGGVATGEHRQKRRSIPNHVTAVQEGKWSGNSERKYKSQVRENALCEGYSRGGSLHV